MKLNYVWCLHCETAHRLSKWRRKKKDEYGYGHCPICGANEFMDGWSWNHEFRFVNGYPDVPEEGKYYPMYP